MARASSAVVLTALLVAATIPHAREDFRFGEFGHHGILQGLAFAALLVVYALQAGGVVLAFRGSAVGLRLLAVTGIIWCAGALAIHGGEIVASGPYRDGLVSKGLEVAIIVLGAAVAAAATAALGRSRR